MPSDAPTDGHRARGYAVLAQLLEHGATGVDPELARVFDPDVDPDALRSEYVAAFDLGVPPYASAFLEADRCVGGRVTSAITDRIGHAPPLSSCHLATGLGHAAALLRAGQGERARAFVGDVVLPWLPAFAVVMDDQPVPFWRAVVRQALDLAAEHVGAVPVAGGLVPADVADPLGERSGLADIATWLGTPAAVGTFISDADLVAIGRAVELPRGFGTRAQRIETFLRSAVDQGRVPQAVRGLAGLLEQRKAALHGLGRTHVHPSVVAPWTQRLERGLQVTKALTEAALRS